MSTTYIFTVSFQVHVL